MKAGVLIAGSLAWETTGRREEWRRKRLSMKNRRLATAPLRYGRRSKGRDCTFTMVFSFSCVKDGRATGIGLAVPFIRELKHVDDLLDEAVHLWRVESNGKVGVRGAVSAKWGAVALLVNPMGTVEPDFLEGWKRAVECSPNYGELRTAAGEPAILDPESGLAQFSWPEPADSDEALPFDALLLTATDPEIAGGEYADLAMVARAWNANKDQVRYFRENRKLGIWTADDEEIEGLLESS